MYLGLNLEHAEKALSELARYHALGIATKKKLPNFFNKAVKQAQVLGIDFQQCDYLFLSTLENFKSESCFNKYMKTIEVLFANTLNGQKWKAIPKEPWATITHGDFWVNNLLFRKDMDGKVDDVKFVDFQTYLFNSPLKDIPYFMCGSLDEETCEKHFDHLINFYYDRFIHTLKLMKCDISPFTKNSFHEELKEQALNEFPLCAATIKLFVHEVEGAPKTSGEVLSDAFTNHISDVFRNRLLRLVGIYEKKGWF